jgi:putative phosphoesterase
MASSQIVGVISDTHGPLLSPVFGIFKDIDAVIHAGDFGSMEPVIELEAIAPLYGVSGNVDDWDIRSKFPPSRMVEINGVNFYIKHILGDPSLHYMKLKNDPVFQSADMVVSGHTHYPLITRYGKYTYLNPGSARMPRSAPSPSVALVTVDQGKIINTEIIYF